jgi:putative ubiquitin-RnfH superfamily antitoxin RatB of RatAB toxin-antitoxin module
MIRVEVAYALPERQQIIALDVKPGCTVLEAAQRSNIAQQFPDIDLTTAALGIFGKVIEKPGETLVRDGDRVEIYRPLLIDPKTVRQQRAAKKSER